ncbi:hypothetical protein [Streptomyces cucumeris]|uniref:hypothetical protein n=1 Tax=Streptomyces cucumeris TaxID=2962890 RepID=UPI003D74E26C
MNTGIALLEKTAKQWDEAAQKFETAQGSYNSGVRPVGLDGTWNGAAASVALPTMVVTYDQFLAAPKEARAIASLLRDAPDQFVRLRSDLTSVIAEAKKAGMAVSGDDLARYDFSDCTEQEKFSIQHDPELKDTGAAWNQRISQAVKAVDDADQGAKLALKAAVEHPDKPGTVNGFNAGAQGDIEKAEAKEATDLSKKLAQDGKLSARAMEEMHRLLRDNQGQKASSQTYFAGLDPEETAKINYKLNGLAHGDAKQDILAVQQGMAMSIASAAKNPQDPFYGSYDAISSDVIFDKRDKGVQWARDVNHHVNSSIGAVLNFVPEKSIPAVDAGLRLVDFAMYDWTKEQIAEANAAVNHDNRQHFTVGRGQVDNLVWQWGGRHGRGPDAGDYMMRELINDSHGAHEDGRNQAYVYLDRDK